MNALRLVLIASAMLLGAGHIRAEEAKQTTVFLWPEKVKEFEGKPTEEIFVSKKKKKNDDTLRLGQIHSPSITVFHAPPSDKPTPAILISPGGGYVILAIDKTGTDIARWCASIGVTGIVLKYSVPNKKVEALQDIQRAMGVIRQNAKAWNINPDQVSAMGFSAGTPTMLTGENSDVKIEAVSVPFPDFIDVPTGSKKPTFFRVGVSMN